MSRNFLTKAQIKHLSPKELLDYKKMLNDTYYSMLAEIEELQATFKYTTQILQERLTATKLQLKQAEKDRINLDPDYPSIIYDETKLTIN